MHLNSETALDFLEGRLEKEQETFWNQHLQGCGECRQNVGQWRQLGNDLQRFHLESAPDHDLKNAIHIFPQQPETARPKLRQVLAATMFDNFREPAFAGARGVAGAARQLVLRAEEFDIHIKIWGEQDHLQMLGQLLSRIGDDFVQATRFHLLQNGETLETTGGDELGEFHFTEVPEGDLSLQIDLPDFTVIGALNTKQIH